MKGMGTDENEIIEIAARYSTDERLKIAQQYKDKYGQRLHKVIKRELSGDLEDILSEVFEGRYICWARYVHDAIAWLGTDENLLI